MNVKSETTGTSAIDSIKLALAAAALIGGIAVWYFYAELSVLIRVSAVLGGIVLAILIGLQSEPGREFWRFTQSARVELRKVIWPNKDETMQTTLAVIAFAIAMGVFFWLLDMLLLWATRILTGQGG